MNEQKQGWMLKMGGFAKLEKNWKLELEAVTRAENYSTLGIKKSVLGLESKERLGKQMSSQKVFFNDLDLRGLSL